MNEILQLKITLNETEPNIWRRVWVRRDMTFLELHIVIQIAMGWKNCHLFDFKLSDIIISLPNDEDIYSENEVLLNASEETLLRLLNTPEQKISYEYDFGDGWEHTIEVEKILPQETWYTYPMCIDGELSCPPEDSGGVHGFYRMLKIVENKKHPEYKELSTWLGKRYKPEVFISEKANEELLKMDKWLEMMFEE